ncbi:MAG TPA: aldo/keto reductase [Thermoanaerobaculia bacterium]|jgi:alcohol dehydrogenase (NADP+)
MNLPPVGFGTSPYRGGARIDIEEPVRLALAAGYRMFDLAEMYGTERAVGRALRTSGTPRRELQLIGKAWKTNFRPEHLRRACADSLQRLGVEAFDLYLLHAPDALQHVAPLEEPQTIGWDEFQRRALPAVTDDVPLRETWEAMQALRAAGLTAEIGVSNFTPEQIELLGEPHPAANQVACWPSGWQQRDAMTVLVYSPLRRDLLATPLLATIASAHARTPAQILLRWLVQRGVHPLTSSTDPARIRQSLALDFELATSDMSALDDLAATIS